MKKLFSVIALILALSLVLCSCKKAVGNKDETPNTDGSEQTDTPTVDYSQTAAFAANHTFNLSEMAYLFFGTFTDFYSIYGSYLSYLGIDLEKSFKEQPCNFEEGVEQSWFDYFLVSTKLYAEQFLVLSEAAKASGETLSDEDRAEIDASIKDLKDYAIENKFDLQEYLDMTYGNGVTEEHIRNVLEITFLASNYYEKVYEGYTFTEDEYKAFEEENFKDEENYNFVNVRHILVETEDEAKTLLDEILKAENVEEAFIKTAGEKTLDGGSKTTGGLYEDIYKGQMVTDFNDWCFDAARKPGDTGIVSSTHGYHIMYFVSFSEKNYFRETADDEMRSKLYNEQYDKWLKEYPVTFNDEVLNKIDA